MQIKLAETRVALQVAELERDSIARLPAQPADEQVRCNSVNSAPFDGLLDRANVLEDRF